MQSAFVSLLFIVKQKPSAVLVVLKSFDYLSELSEGLSSLLLREKGDHRRWWMRSCFGFRTPHPSADKRLSPSPTGEG